MQTACMLDVLIGLLIHSLDLENANNNKKKQKRQWKDLVIQLFRRQAPQLGYLGSDLDSHTLLATLGKSLLICEMGVIIPQRAVLSL